MWGGKLVSRPCRVLITPSPWEGHSWGRELSFKRGQNKWTGQERLWTGKIYPSVALQTDSQQAANSMAKEGHLEGLISQFKIFFPCLSIFLSKNK